MRTVTAKRTDPSCCGSVMDRLTMVREVTSRIAQGHQMLAIMYRQLQTEASSGDKEAFGEAAASHERMMIESNKVTVPDGFRFPDEEDAHGIEGAQAQDPQDVQMGGGTRPQGPPYESSVFEDARPLVPG